MKGRSPPRIEAAFLCVLVGAEARAGFFRVKEEHGVYWLVDGQGAPFFSTGVNVVDPGVEPAKLQADNPAYSALLHHPSLDAWADATVARLQQWGFNTLGGWSHEAVRKRRALPYTVSLDLGRWVGAPWVDVTSAESRKKIRQLVEPIARYRGDPLLIGYFSDNELGWWDETLFIHWLSRPWDDAPKQTVWRMLAERYRTSLRSLLRDFEIVPRPASFADLKGKLERVRVSAGRSPPVIDTFVERMAEDYYRVVSEEIRKADPDHLVLGDRFTVGHYSQAVARAAGKYLDVVSINYNTFSASGWAAPSHFETLFRLARKPILVTEFYFAARENRTGNANAEPWYVLVQTQAERATGAHRLAERFARLPYVVGYHWFRYYDYPPREGYPGYNAGDDNVGLVDVHDQPCEGLVAAFADVNSRAAELHRKGRLSEGLRRRGEGWALARAAGEWTLDGRLDDWDLAAAWVPGPRARGPLLPFGDFYLAWTPDGFRVGVAYDAYSERWADPAVPEDGERLTLALARGEHAPVVFTVEGLRERAEAQPPVAPLRANAAGGAMAQPPPPGVVAAQSPGFTRVAEVFVPAASLGPGPLAAGETLRFGASIKLRGDARENFWPVSLAGAAVPAARLARLLLVATPPSDAKAPGRR